MTTLHDRTKRADLASSGGAGLLGAGLAALVGLTGIAWTLGLLLTGVVLHGWGMIEHRRLERDGGLVAGWWWDALWWGCWIAILALGAWLVFRTV